MREGVESGGRGYLALRRRERRGMGVRARRPRREVGSGMGVLNVRLVGAEREPLRSK